MGHGWFVGIRMLAAMLLEHLKQELLLLLSFCEGEFEPVHHRNAALGKVIDYLEKYAS